MDTNQGTTLRDELSSSFDTVMDATIPGPVESAPVVAATETDSQREERVRDEAGRFAKAEAAKTNEPLAGKPNTQQAAPKGQEQTAQPAAAQQRPPRPSSWKKDFESHWEQLDPKLAEYINQREREYASGVSTYKSEAENARSLNEAIAPFLPNLQRHNVEPTQWIRNLGMAHERLALGSPQDKVATTIQLLRDYQIDPNAVFQALQNPQAYQPVPQHQPAPQVDIDKLVEQKFVEREVKSEYDRFVADAPTKYPHYESVKETMAGLLQAGLAQDYKTAYEAALRHPRHDDIWQAERQQREQAEVAAAAEKAKGVVNRARSNAVSVRSSTPSGNMATSQGNKGLRDSIAEAFDSVAGGRV